MEYENTVFVQTEGISHTYATSTIRVEINPNATVGQEEFYYAFCVSYNTSLDYALIACASNDGEGLEIQHRWEKNGYAKVRVGVFPKASYKNLIGCNTTQGTRVAGREKGRRNLLCEHFGLATCIYFTYIYIRAFAAWTCTCTC